MSSTLNSHDPVMRYIIEGSKKGTSSKDFQDDGHNNSGPSVHVKLLEGSIKSTKKCHKSQNYRTLNGSTVRNKVFLGCTRYNKQTNTNRKSGATLSGLVTQRL